MKTISKYQNAAPLGQLKSSPRDGAPHFSAAVTHFKKRIHPSIPKTFSTAAAAPLSPFLKLWQTAVFLPILTAVQLNLFLSN
ncbi:hypothetical protein CLOSTMETH_03838 [[Clostridium] methylpentosum DSM 5476]|uniref:Uncharacterized protein n=1 Tax=[Clostridium] methylpentosum DSM 5476 TaxID=537013 RepID=C0EIZ3_9FIRM|nr:hypothetical protein CLOSTMETH_03838 [[Clostridium] methylpentosum DSM 5476]